VSKNDTDRVRELLQQAKRAETVLQLCLRGDVQAEIDELELQLKNLKGDILPSLGDSPEAKPIAEQIQALVDEAQAATISVRLRALPRRQWQELVVKYPAKSEDYLYDADSLLGEAIPACWVSPELDSDTLEKVLDELSQGQYDELAQAVTALNRGEGRVPFSALASAVLRNSSEKSKPPTPSA
jgi:hypothetical protein